MLLSIAPYLLMAAEAETATNTNLLIRGLLALSIAVVFLIGSVWLLLSLVIGVRMGYLVMGSVLFGVILILSLIWTVTALGPTNPETTWFGAGVGPNVAQLSHGEETFDASDYPSEQWQEPRRGEHLADLEGSQDTLAERDNALPVMRAFLSLAINPETQQEIADLTSGPIGLESGNFEIVDLRFKPTSVEDKESLIAMGRAVPSERLLTQGVGDDEWTVESYLVEPGDSVSEGDPILRATREGESPVDVTASSTGTIVSLGQREGDRIKDGVPIAIADVSGQPGAPDPVEVGAVRVKGFPRKPAIIYLIVSALLFALHMGLLRNAERARRPKVREPEEPGERKELVAAP